MSPAPILHILDKVDYSKHRLVTLPSDPLPTLPRSSLRIQSRILSLTTNNFTYAKLGFRLGWWDVYPQPSNTPEPYNDHSTYGRVCAWGYAEILESTVPDIPAGKTVYGYIPTSTLPEDIEIEQTGLKDQIIVTSPHRQHLWKIYNRYQVLAPLAELEASKSASHLGWDALTQVLFGTSYNLSAYAFAWKDQNLIHPSGTGAWSASDANLDRATVICLSASGKTAMSFAHQLRTNRPQPHQPATIIGVCSAASQPMAQASGFYDKIALYDDAEPTSLSIAQENNSRRVVLVDFGARHGAATTWYNALSSTSTASSIPVTFLSVGVEVKPASPAELAKSMGQAPPKMVQVSANALREKGLQIGGDEYLEEFYAKFEEFKAGGGIPGVEIIWHEGMEAWREGWERLCRDGVKASEGLVYRL